MCSTILHLESRQEKRSEMVSSRNNTHRGISGDYSAVPTLKGSKHEIFESGFFTEIRPVRIGDLGTGEKK